MTRDAAKKAVNISSLMSPPEPLPLDSFSQQSHQQNATAAFSSCRERNAAKPSMPMSPPISPSIPGLANATGPETSPAMAKDPILYPREDTNSSTTQPPLFPSHESLEHRRIVDEHIVARPPGLFREASPPQREDYELVLHLRSQVMKLVSKDPRSWLEKERNQVRADRKLNSSRWNSGGRYQTIAPAKAVTVRKIATSKTKAISTPTNPRADRVSKPQTARAVRASPPVRHRRVSATPDPARRVVAPNREDRDFGSLPDYCPPLSSLPDKPNCLKVDWKGAPIDLSEDFNINLLHPDELSLAANLRLDCATYLTSKRRIFKSRLECVMKGKEFRKTDAQQACKIDVNKASKLWLAFDKVGWLDPNWMASFI
ncbi:SWIRM domain-containing protein FUN19 [Colletotrichum sidae]|uniref:SWIRM domain-containing protein FUN19 n=1 Tax=Colletotrichum sidae TaxID=1347389 RepID=A0A4R8T552_9PEZI|nr:SWIRM domain-containing protein FUN19 [Colletotrichum sidae]